MQVTPDALISIYDAAISNRNWNRALDHCADLMGAKVSLLYEFSKVANVQYEYSLERSCSTTGSIASTVAEYNDMVRGGQGSGYDMEGIPFIDSRPL